VQINKVTSLCFGDPPRQKIETGYKGPAICIGSNSELIVGYKGGQLITAHRTQVYLHESVKSPEPVKTLSGLNRPSGHTSEWKRH
jgi:hypothetical protein